MGQTLAPRRAGFQAALRAETEACVATTLDPATLKRMRDAIEKKV